MNNVKRESKKNCEDCVFFIRNNILEEEIKKAKESQEHYLVQVKKMNETLAKYTQKIEELDKKGEI